MNTEAEIVAPRLISASRATDIPAFYARWLLDCLEAGYCRWQNPFNAGQIQNISFKNCLAFIFWTKNPAPLMPFLEKFNQRGYRYYFQFTLNNYEDEGLEPGVPPLAKRLEAMKKLSKICPVVWRYDPVIMGGSLNVNEHLRRIRDLLAWMAPFTEKLVFSFADIISYRNARNRLRKNHPALREPDAEEMLEFASGLAAINRASSKPLILATCAEQIDLVRYGIQKNKCIDPDLLNKICPPAPGNVFSLMPLKLFGAKKDKGQRKTCGCIKSKDIGSYKMACGHGCAYCYANHGKTRVLSK